MIEGPIADRGHTRVPSQQTPKFLRGEPKQLVGFAVAARVQVSQHLGRQVFVVDFFDVGRVDFLAMQFRRGLVADRYLAGSRIESQQPIPQRSDSTILHPMEWGDFYAFIGRGLMIVLGNRNVQQKSCRCVDEIMESAAHLNLFHRIACVEETVRNGARSIPIGFIRPS